MSALQYAITALPYALDVIYKACDIAEIMIGEGSGNAKFELVCSKLKINSEEERVVVKMIVDAYIAIPAIKEKYSKLVKSGCFGCCGSKVSK